MNIQGDYRYLLQVVGDSYLWIGKHSEIHGKAKESYRHIFNLNPDEGVTYWYNKVKDNPLVTMVASPNLAPFSISENQVWFCTFLDPEENCWLFVGQK